MIFFKLSSISQLGLHCLHCLFEMILFSFFFFRCFSYDLFQHKILTCFDLRTKSHNGKKIERNDIENSVNMALRMLQAVFSRLIPLDRNLFVCMCFFLSFFVDILFPLNSLPSFNFVEWQNLHSLPSPTSISFSSVIFSGSKNFSCKLISTHCKRLSK